MRISLVLALAVAVAPFSAVETGAQSKQPFNRDKERFKANESMLVIMAGDVGGSYLQMANDIAMVANDASVRVLPVASSGAVTNIKDILLLKGVDMGITSVQVSAG